MRVANRSNYERSNAIATVDFVPTSAATALTQAILASVHADERQRLGEALLDELCDTVHIDICKLKVSDTRQYHRRLGGRTVFKQYGYYRMQSRYIYIQNRTAVRGHPLAPKTFLDTLLHEWLHHYDTLALRLHSIHTAGFYQRLHSLKMQLRVATHLPQPPNCRNHQLENKNSSKLLLLWSVAKLLFQQTTLLPPPPVLNSGHCSMHLTQ